MNNARNKRIVEMFERRGEDFHALVCRTPQNIVMLTGYQPILGNSFCVVTVNKAREVEIRRAVPEDEEDRVPPGVAVEVKTFVEETVAYIGNTIQSVREPLAELLRAAHVNKTPVIGYEGIYSPIATAYTQVGAPGPATFDLLHKLFLGGYLVDATSMFNELASVKTEAEIDFMRRCEEVGRQGFLAAREAVCVGATEADVAAATYATLLRAGYAAPGANHVLPYVH